VGYLIGVIGLPRHTEAEKLAGNVVGVSVDAQDQPPRLRTGLAIPV
jgi:hypothetical protein